ncbi:MAG: hypothetical protein WDN28_25735 [Chthoniobacter sp.]
MLRGTMETPLSISNGALYCLDVVELHGVFDLDGVIAEMPVDHFARGQVGLEGDEPSRRSVPRS